MGMPITIEILDAGVSGDTLDAVFSYFHSVDRTFSTYQESSEISRINRGELGPDDYSEDMRTILALSAKTKAETQGYFDIARDGWLDPSGIVKGWAIQQAADRLRADGWHDFYIDAGGDIEFAGLNAGKPWRVGIRNPFDRQEIVKVLAVSNCGLATSGTAIRGQHIYNPFRPADPILDIVSLTVIGPNVFEADRFATAAFARGMVGICFIESLDGFEGYQIDANARAALTSGFGRYVTEASE